MTEEELCRECANDDFWRGYKEGREGRDALLDRIATLEAALREAYEVYAGSDGFIPETAAEGYLQQLISEMVAIIGAELKK
jgi:hypothetical protein